MEKTMKKRIVHLLLSMLLAFATLVIPAQADPVTGQSYEVVLMLDMSGSTTLADPDRICIQAAKAFAYYHPSQAKSFHLSVVLYNTKVTTALRSANVVTDQGMNDYQTCLDTVGDLRPGEKYDGFTCWSGDTDIGAALKRSEQILSASKADNKAAILFTDGKIDLDNDFSVDTPDEILSETNSFAVANAFAGKNIPIYAVGLNRNGSVDRAYLEKLADITDGKCMICADADDLVTFFQTMYAAFVGGTVGGGTTIPTRPHVQNSHTVNIYGQAISEANLVLYSTSEIESYSVVNPNGVTVAQWKRGDGKDTLADGCTVNRSEYLVNVKLRQPADGDWRITFASTSTGTVQIGEIYLYNLTVEHDAPKKIALGDTVELSAALYNADTKSRITTETIYERSECKVTVKSDRGDNTAYVAELNSAHNGYAVSLPFKAPGKYEIIYSIVNEQFSVETTGTLEVLAPDILLKADKTGLKAGEEVKITASLKHPVSGEAMTVPAYLTGFRLKAQVKCDGTVLTDSEVNFISESDISFTYRPTKGGKYEISVTLTRYDETIASKTPISFTVWSPTLQIKPDSTQVGRGEALGFTVQLINPATGDAIPPAEYPAGYKVTVTAEKDGTSVASTEVTPAENGTLRGTLTIGAAGEYAITAELKADGEITYGCDTPVTVAVGQPKLALITTGKDPMMGGDPIALQLQLIGVGGSVLDTCPAYMEGYTVRLFADGSELQSSTVGALMKGEAALTFTPSAAGDALLSVKVEGNGEVMESSLTVTVKPSRLTLVGEALSDIKQSTLAGEITHKIDLSELFEDSDGDDLSFSVKVDDESIGAEIEDEMLILTLPSGVRGEVTLEVSDGKGAKLTVSFGVEVTSMLPLLIGIVIAVLVIAAAIPVTILIIKKRSIIRIRYRIKLEHNTEVSSYYAVYEIGKASNSARATPKMTVRAILQTGTLAHYVDGDMDEYRRDELISAYCDRVTLTGFPFREGFKISVAGKNDMTYTGMKTSVKLPSLDPELAGESLVISFGKTSDFNQD